MLDIIANKSMLDWLAYQVVKLFNNLITFLGRDMLRFSPSKLGFLILHPFLLFFTLQTYFPSLSGGGKMVRHLSLVNTSTDVLDTSLKTCLRVVQLKPNPTTRERPES